MQKIEGEMVGKGCCVIVGGRITVAPPDSARSEGAMRRYTDGGGMDLSTSLIRQGPLKAG